MLVIRTQLIRQLRELIAALDRRIPQMDRPAEASIAREAASLKETALKRIAELEGHDTRDVSAREATTAI